MPNELTFTVKPNLPARLAPLAEMAHDFWISWNFDAIRLFMRIDNDLWFETRQTPVLLLGAVAQERLQELARDEAFLAHMDRVYVNYRAYLEAESWYRGPRDGVVAYFSMEFGLDVALPIYSGGLGVLSGDHLKSCSDLGLPVVGVGLLYRTGYFRQHVGMDGQQQESYPANDFYNLPLSLCSAADGAPLTVAVELGEDLAHAQVWRVAGGQGELCTCWTPICRSTMPPPGTSPASCTSPTAAPACARNCCWASAASARCGHCRSRWRLPT